MLSYSDLAARVKALDAADRETDVLIGEAIDLIAYGDIGIRKCLRLCGLDDLVRDADDQGNIWSNKLPRYTASFDAVNTLLGTDTTRRIEYGTYENGTGWAYVYVRGTDGREGTGDAANEVLALLAATLTALALPVDNERDAA